MYRHEQLYIPICRCMQKHIQLNKDERTQFFRKIYFSLYLKGLCVRGELETEQRLQHIDPPAPPAIAVCLFHSPGLLNWGPGAQHLCWELVPTARSGTLTSSSELQLIWTSCRWGYITIWRPPTSCECHNSHSIQPLNSQDFPLIPWYLWPDAPVIYTGAFLLLTARLGSICNGGLIQLFQ